MNKGLIVETKWSPITETMAASGERVKIKSSAGGGFGTILALAPSKARVIVETRGEIKSFLLSEILIKTVVYADLLREFDGTDAMTPQNPNDPELQRINMYKARIARDQLELSKLVMKYTKKQQAKRPQQPKTPPGTYTSQQMKAMQNRSNQNAQAAQQGFPALQQTR